ncbi:molybdopterin cofactor-binding domain-containing protein [Paeniroseomonas aquatica]|uniref:molybdopterin cofactor-binding domain-containing protein n=1 Tax=Paeniroseomonas aquatica TaxID=373043 RepID=UPI003617E3F1
MLGIDYNRVSVQIGDTASIGYSNLTGGSRVLFASAMVVTQSTEKVITTLRERAAKIWKIDPEAVTWEDGEARPAGDNAGNSPASAWPTSPPARARPAARSAPASSSIPPAPRAASPPISATWKWMPSSGSSGCCATPRSRTSAVPSTRATSKARCRAAPPRASAGR